MKIQISSVVTFQFTFPAAGDFRKVLETISTLTKDACFNVNEQGLFLSSIDSSRVCLIQLEMPGQDYFSSFRVNQATMIPVKIANLMKVIKFAGSDDSITFSQQRSQSDQIQILIESKKYAQTMNFTLHLTQQENEDTSPDEFQPETVVEMSSARWSGLVKDLSSIGTTLTISSNSQDQSINLSCKSDESSACINVANGKDEEEGSDIKTMIQVKKDITLSFAIKYFMQFGRAQSLSDKVRLEFADGNPVAVKYTFSGNCKLNFLLACSVDSENEEELNDAQNDADDEDI